MKKKSFPLLYTYIPLAYLWSIRYRSMVFDAWQHYFPAWTQESFLTEYLNLGDL